MERRYGLFLALLVLVSFVSAHTSSNGHNHASKKSASGASNVQFAEYGHMCDHDLRAGQYSPPKEIDQSQAKRMTAAVRERDGLRRNALAWLPFRITAVFDNINSDPNTCYNAGDVVTISGGPYTCTAEDVLTPEKLSYLNESMIQAAVSRFSDLLRVDRGFITVGSSSGGCDATIPARYRGTIDTDFVLLVTVRPIPSSGSGSRTLAYATTCQTGTDQRPIVGWANFDPSSLDPTDDTKLALQVGVAAHEITHSLGFNYGAFNSRGMITATGTSYTVTSPKVLAFVRSHFGCGTASGALLEDDGGAGTASSHWEKSMYFNEFMTGTAGNTPVISPLTLLAFEDTGWYQSNLAKSDSLVFGRAAGCGMADTRGCSGWPSSYRCDGATGTIAKCTADRAGYGSCVTEPDSGSLIGAGCTYYGAQSTCIFPFPPNSPQAIARAGSTTFQSSGQSFAADARCFDSTLNKIASLTEIVPIPAPNTPKCYRVHCTAPDEPRLSINNIWYPCIPTSDKIFATDFGGSVSCPAATAPLDLCQYRERDEDWPRIVSVTPKKAKPGTDVTIAYSGAQNETDMQAIIEFDCTDEVTTNGSFTARLADSDAWGSPKYLNLFQTKLNIIIRDSQGRSDVTYKNFQADIGFGLAYLKALWNWMKKHVLFTVLICIAIAIPILISIFCCYKKCCKKKKKKPLRTQYQHAYNREGDAYYFDEEMEDRSRHAPPRPIQS